MHARSLRHGLACTCLPLHELLSHLHAKYYPIDAHATPSMPDKLARNVCKSACLKRSQAYACPCLCISPGVECPCA
eukprot:337122-Pelagomonas_calceolata.AAC.7